MSRSFFSFDFTQKEENCQWPTLWESLVSHYKNSTTNLGEICPICLVDCFCLWHTHTHQRCQALPSLQLGILLEYCFVIQFYKTGNCSRLSTYFWVISSLAGIVNWIQEWMKMLIETNEKYSLGFIKELYIFYFIYYFIGATYNSLVLCYVLIGCSGR